MELIEWGFKYQSIKFTTHQAPVALLSEKLGHKYLVKVSVEDQLEAWRKNLVKRSSTQELGMPTLQIVLCNLLEVKLLGHHYDNHNKCSVSSLNIIKEDLMLLSNQLTDSQEEDFNFQLIISKINFMEMPREAKLRTNNNSNNKHHNWLKITLKEELGVNFIDGILINVF
tara:strand:- start:914 stop:1423 length:510 start_codon:yes stop_codon:yes gene_type:complete